MELAQNTLPLGKFDPIYPDTMFEEIRLPRDASTSERLSHRRWAESQTKMRLHNDKVKAARDAWWSNALNLYFELITSTMVKHQPNLRDRLRQTCYLGEGRYDGLRAMKDVSTWIEKQHVLVPQTDLYDGLLARALSNRPGEGVSDENFLKLTHQLIHEIVPFMRAPYEGEELGLLIIEKIMPTYTTAAENLVRELRESGELNDPMVVEARCAAICAKRKSAKPSAGTNAAVASLVAELEVSLLGEVKESNDAFIAPQTTPGTKFCDKCPHIRRDGTHGSLLNRMRISWERHPYEGKGDHKRVLVALRVRERRYIDHHGRTGR